MRGVPGLIIVNILLFLSVNSSLKSEQYLSPLISTESDPDAFIEDCINVINGDYCEATTDLTVYGPDILVLQRFYSTKDAVIGSPGGGWRILPQRYLVVGKHSNAKECSIGNEKYELSLAFSGEKSGGILPYIGWRNASGISKDPFNLDIKDRAKCVVNTYVEQISGQTNHRNNQLTFSESECQLTTADGTVRVFEKVKMCPNSYLGEELNLSMSSQVIDPEYFQLIEEILPSGNKIFYSYDGDGHLLSIVMKNKNQTKILSWINFSYLEENRNCTISLSTSENKTLEYKLKKYGEKYQLIEVKGSHFVPVKYHYNPYLVKKDLPDGRFIDIEYDKDRVIALRKPHPTYGKPELSYSFVYADGYTEVINALGYKKRIYFDQKNRLSAIERYDCTNKIYRIDRKYWGGSKKNTGLLTSRTIEDGENNVKSFRGFEYDSSGNVINEHLYGNLTGKQAITLKVSNIGELLNQDEVECHTKRFSYSKDGYNLLVEVGDSKGNKTCYKYKEGTNLLLAKYIYCNDYIERRTFHSYNEDAVRIKTIEDDGSSINSEKIYYHSVTERHITEIHPKETLPGIGLPLTIEKKSLDLEKKEKRLIKKWVNTFDSQSNLISSSTYDSNDTYVFTEYKSYNHLGQVITQEDAIGRVTGYTYDALGNLITVSKPFENKQISFKYNYHNLPVEKITETPNGKKNERFYYDLLDRKITSTDQYGNTTQYRYDFLDRMIEIKHPEVVNENSTVSSASFHYQYDIFGNVTAVIDPMGFVISKEYNLRGDPTKIKYPDGTYELFKYDPEGSLHRSLTRDNIITVYEYDFLGRCIYEEVYTSNEKGTSGVMKTKSYAYNAFRCIYERDGHHAKHYKYDYTGKLKSINQPLKGRGKFDPDARRTEFIYDSLGRIHQKKVWFDLGEDDYSIENYTYDLLGNVTQEEIYDSKGQSIINKHFSYDLMGNCVEEYTVNNSGITSLIETEYDYDGEPIKYIDALGNTTHISIDYSYLNSMGQNVVRKNVVNCLGVQTEIEFDALGRVHRINKKDPLGNILSSQRTFYDSVGNKCYEEHEKIKNGEVLQVQQTHWKHGPMGRLDEFIQAEGTPDENRKHYTYNSLGKLINVTSSGEAIEYIYNKEGRIYRIKGNSQSGESISNKYSYDNNGNVISAYALGGKSVRRTYNQFDQVTNETVNDGIDTYSLSYQYDRKGRLTEIHLPDTSKINYKYDALFCREIKRISSSGDQLYHHIYDEYDQTGKLTKETFGGYLGSQKTAYDHTGNKIEITNPFFHEENIRDALGRVVEVKGDNHASYSYNDLSQLISEKEGKETKYGYDSLDNRVIHDKDTLEYNSRNQLIKSANSEFSYDPNGNLLRKVLDGEEITYNWNILSQLENVQALDQLITTFSYDPFGRILVEKLSKVEKKKKRNLSTKRYFYIGYQEIGSLSQTGEIETLKVPGMNGDTLSQQSISIEIGSERYVPIHDISGNIIKLIDSSSGDAIESYEYTAFGEETIYNVCGEKVTKSVIGNPWRFSGKRVNENLQLVYFGLRFYDPSIGRWISEDPIGYTDGPNLYSYLHNNPVNHLDRYGLSTETQSEKEFSDYFYGEVEPYCFCERHRTCKRGGFIGKTVSSCLPTIIYNDTFESTSSAPPSTTYDLSDMGMPELPDDLGIGFINGINTDFEGSRECAEYISKLSGGYNVHGVYNATHGMFNNLFECLINLHFVATEPVRQLHNMWSSFFEKNSKDAKFLMICHSQGAILVRNALLDFPPELRERILVVAIAPGGYIYSETCAQVIHYRAEWYRDGIPQIDRSGAQREKHTTKVLKSHPEAPAFDHFFKSKTYIRVLRKHLLNYIKSGGVEI